MINKKNPKIFLRKSEDNLTASLAPIIAPIMPVNVKGIQMLLSIFLFLIWVIIAIAATGIKEKRFTLCACCCVKFVKSINEGISIVPPPIPMPLIIPEKNPIIEKSI